MSPYMFFLIKYDGKSWSIISDLTDDYEEAVKWYRKAVSVGGSSSIQIAKTIYG